MRKLRLCLVLPLFGMFACSLTWLYLQAQLSERPQIEPPLFLNRPSQSDWDLFLSRRNTELPSLSSSLSPWNPSEALETSEFPVRSFPLIEVPNLSSNSNVSCILRKFGFTRAQASEVYNSNKKLRNCGDGRNSFLKITNKYCFIQPTGARLCWRAVGGVRHWTKSVRRTAR